MPTDATFWPTKANPPPRPDLRDERARSDPGRWQLPGRPATENPHPAGGKIEIGQYRHKGPRSPVGADGQSTPFFPGNGAGIKTER